MDEGFVGEFMDRDKEKLEISVIGRLLSIEALLLLMGAAMLVSGVLTIQVARILWGGVIVLGALALYFIRRKESRKQGRFCCLNERKEREPKEHNHAGKG